MRIALYVALILVGIWIVASGFMYFFQRKFQYWPDTDDVALPRGERYAGLEDVAFQTSDDVTLRAWYWPGTRDTVLILFHGNAGNRANRLEWLEPFHALGWGLLFVDYRGYGGSSGAPSEEGLYLDAEAAVDYLRGRGVEHLVYIGESLGVGVAVEAAVRRPPRAIILQAGAASLVPIGRRLYPWLPIESLMKDRYEAAKRIPDVQCPVLCIHGTDDGHIPLALGRELFDAAPEPKEWYPVEGGGHNNLPATAGREYYARVQAFLESAQTNRR